MTDTNIIIATDNDKQNKPPIVVMRERLQERKGELKAALTDIDPDHFIRALITSAQVNPELQACSFQSLWLACMRACRDNLLPDGREGAIVPYKDKATWIPMYQGLLKRFRESGQCKWITANIVRQDETFEHWVDQTGEHFKHIPGEGNTPVVKVYAAALTKDDAFYVAVMTMAEINKIKNISRATREDAPWKQWPEEMMKKTALRRLSKLLPAGRDIFDEEDEVALPSQPSLVASEEQRKPGAVSALEQFAGSQESQPEQGGEMSRTAEPELDDPLDIAYQRGRIAKQTGAQRRSLPGEYREESNKAEADAWLAGYDGKEFTNPKTGEINGGEATG